MGIDYKGFGGMAYPNPNVSISDTNWSGYDWNNSTGVLSQRAIQDAFLRHTIRPNDSTDSLLATDANKLLEAYYSSTQVPIFAGSDRLNYNTWNVGYNFEMDPNDLFNLVNLTAVGSPVYTSAINGSGISLSGSGQYLENTVDVANLAPTSNLVVSVWLDLSVLTASSDYTIFSITDNLNNSKFSLKINNLAGANGFEFLVTQSSGNPVILSEGSDYLSTGLVHICAIADATAGTLSIYRDSIEVVTTTYDSTLVSTNLNNFYIGSIDGTQQYFNGIIDSFYYSKSISFVDPTDRQNLVNALYNSASGNFMSMGYKKDFRLSTAKSTYIPDPSVATANQAWMSDGTNGFWGNLAVENIFWNGSNWISDTVSVASHQLQNVLKEVGIAYANRTSALLLSDKDKFISATYTTQTSNTGLLLHMDDVLFSDASINNHVVNIINTASVSTADKMFGLSSLVTTYNAGIPQYLTVTDHPSLAWGASSGTLELFCKANVSIIPYMTLISKYTGNMTGFEIRAHSANTELLYGDGTVNTLTHPTNIRDGLWHHIVLMKVVSAIYLFIDGVVSTTVGTATSIDNIDPLYIGNGQTLDNTTWDGFIDEVRSIKQNMYANTGFTPPTASFTVPLEYTLSTTKATDIPDPSTGPTGYVWGTDGTNASWIPPISGGLSYLGNWDTTLNSPTLASGVGVNGNYYIVTKSGATTTTIDGISSWTPGDWIIFNGTTWDKIDNTPLVSSVNGNVGAVVLGSDDITEGINNLYYTDARVIANAVVTANAVHASSLPEHRLINDAGTTATDLWSASKINTEIVNSISAIAVSNIAWTGGNWNSTTLGTSELQIQNALKEVGIDYGSRTSGIVAGDNNGIIEAYYSNGYTLTDLAVYHFDNPSLLDATGHHPNASGGVLSNTNPKFGTNSLDCTSTQIHTDLGISTDWDFFNQTTGDMHIEFNIFLIAESGSPYNTIIERSFGGREYYCAIEPDPNNPGGSRLFYSVWTGSANVFNLITPISINTYHHIIISKKGGQTSYDTALYMDGVQVANALNNTYLLPVTTASLKVNVRNYSSVSVQYYLDELVISSVLLRGINPSINGDTYTVPTVPYTPAVVQKYQLSTAKTTDILANTAHTTLTNNPHTVTTTQIGAAPATTYGYAPLDVNGQIASAILPASVMQYQGTWDASINSPALVDGTGSPGDMYLVSLGGTQNLGSGNITFLTQDYVIYNTNNIWERSPNTFSGNVDVFTNNSVTYAGVTQVADYTFTGFFSAVPIVNSQVLYINSVMISTTHYTIVGLDLTVHFGTIGFSLTSGDVIDVEYMTNATNTWTNQTLIYAGVTQNSTYTWTNAFTNIPHQASISLSFNGLLLKKSQYSIAGQDLILEFGSTIPYALENGDEINLHYEF